MLCYSRMTRQSGLSRRMRRRHFGQVRELAAHITGEVMDPTLAIGAPRQQGVSYNMETNMLDVTGAGDVEIRADVPRRVLWVNEGGRCLLRICRIRGRVHVVTE